jgi:hypothetical protein
MHSLLFLLKANGIDDKALELDVNAIANVCDSAAGRFEWIDPPLIETAERGHEHSGELFLTKVLKVPI